MSRQEVSSSASGFGARARSLMSGSKPRAVASLGIVLGLGAIGTLAAWSDTATATSGVFSTGSIDLQLSDEQGNPDAYAFATLTKENMLPGDRVAAELPVQNTGTTPFNYTMSAAASSSELAPWMKIKVTTGTSDGELCSGDTVATNIWLVGGESVDVVSEPRTLAVGASDNLCIQMRVDPDAPNSVQNKSVEAALNFNATTA
ncbi:SipW-dependent-type signal peptide-containing protein [Rhodococcus marinonascens]|uniref:SipW-dependent-type signal peptide-containing protein n=1 Tax=Rhodococcus marinonascens TaxID=38311 RepID=UPI000932A895|nr:SipW-dependent-type signal peptide-containing protein [Rhodococcus marinonascens]